MTKRVEPGSMDHLSGDQNGHLPRTVKKLAVQGNTNRSVQRDQNDPFEKTAERLSRKQCSELKIIFNRIELYGNPIDKTLSNQNSEGRV